MSSREKEDALSYKRRPKFVSRARVTLSPTRSGEYEIEPTRVIAALSARRALSHLRYSSARQVIRSLQSRGNKSDLYGSLARAAYNTLYKLLGAASLWEPFWSPRSSASAADKQNC